MNNIDKIFYSSYANRNVDFELLSEGPQHPAKTRKDDSDELSRWHLTTGTREIEGRQVVLTNPRLAIENGIGMVHQHFMLVPVFTVWENMVLSLKTNL